MKPIKSFLDLLILAIILCSSLGGCLDTLKPSRDGLLQAEMMRQEQGPYKKTMEAFVRSAVNGDISLLIDMASTNVKNRDGLDAVKRALLETIIPFFADYKRTHNVVGITPARDPFGNRGYAFFSYIVTRSDATRAFWIAVIKENDSLVVDEVTVDRCIRGRHPFC